MDCIAEARGALVCFQPDIVSCALRNSVLKTASKGWLALPIIIIIIIIIMIIIIIISSSSSSSSSISIIIIIKLALHHKQNGSEQKQSLSRLFAINFKIVGRTIFKSTQMLPFPLAAFLFLLCCSAVLSGYCNVSFYFLGILGVMKLHHFAWHHPFN